jgi:hypothetical protein
MSQNESTDSPNWSAQGPQSANDNPPPPQPTPAGRPPSTDVNTRSADRPGKK